MRSHQHDLASAAYAHWVQQMMLTGADPLLVQYDNGLMQQHVVARRSVCTITTRWLTDWWFSPDGGVRGP